VEPAAAPALAVEPLAGRRRALLRRAQACLGAAVVAVALAAAGAPSAWSAETIDWDRLQPPAPPPVANPWAHLPDDQAEAMRQLAISHELEARGLPMTDAGRQRRTALRQQLKDKGVDADALLAQRRELAAKRRAAAEAPLPSLEGRDLRIRGHVLPVVADGNLVSEFLLVPWVGACSHAGTPAPNQIIRVRTPQPVAVYRPYETVWVSGALRLRETQTSLHLVDGTLSVRSSYAVDEGAVVPVLPAPGP
jgi:hypothetical protein